MHLPSPNFSDVRRMIQLLPSDVQSVFANLFNFLYFDVGSQVFAVAQWYDAFRYAEFGFQVFFVFAPHVNFVGTSRLEFFVDRGITGW